MTAIASYQAQGSSSAGGHVPDAVRLTPDSPLWEWAYDALSHRAESMLEHLEGVRLGEDIEAVHDMRVWSRRLVAATKVFAVCFPDDHFRALAKEARSVTRRLGAVRDLDVLIDHFTEQKDDAKPEEHLGIAYLIALKNRERDKARRPMLEALDRVASSGFATRVQRYLREQADAYSVGFGPLVVRGIQSGGVRPEGPFRAAAPPILADRYQEFYEFEPYVSDPQCETELHEMRIGAKWLRYTMEVFGPAYADELKATLSIVKRFQELLGDLHDSDVRRMILAETLGAPLDARALNTVGLMLPEPVTASLRVLQRREEKVRAGCYRAFYKEWRRQEKQGFREVLARRISEPDAGA